MKAQGFYLWEVCKIKVTGDNVWNKMFFDAAKRYNIGVNQITVEVR